MGGRGLHDLRRLVVFRAVAREGSLSAGARALGYTQPAVAHHVSRLEGELGVKLFVRRTDGVALTPAGAALASRADSLLAAAATAAEEVTQTANGTRSAVRLAAFPSAAATIVPTAMVRLRRRDPALELDVVLEDPPASIELVRHGKVDVALTFEHSGQDDEDRDLARLAVRTDEMLIVVPPTHPLADRSDVGMAELAEEQFIGGCARCQAQLVALCDAAGFAPRIAHSTRDYVAARGMVAAGLGVALLPSLALEATHDRDLAVLRLDQRPTRTIAALVRREAASRPSLRALVAALAAPAGGRA